VDEDGNPRHQLTSEWVTLDACIRLYGFSGIIPFLLFTTSPHTHPPPNTHNLKQQYDAGNFTITVDT